MRSEAFHRCSQLRPVSKLVVGGHRKAGPRDDDGPEEANRAMLDATGVAGAISSGFHDDSHPGLAIDLLDDQLCERTLALHIRRLLGGAALMCLVLLVLQAEGRRLDLPNRIGSDGQTALSKYGYQWTPSRQ